MVPILWDNMNLQRFRYSQNNRKTNTHNIKIKDNIYCDAPNKNSSGVLSLQKQKGNTETRGSKQSCCNSDKHYLQGVQFSLKTFLNSITLYYIPYGINILFRSASTPSQFICIHTSTTLPNFIKHPSLQKKARAKM